MKVDFAKVHRNNPMLEFIILTGLLKTLSEKEFHEYADKRNKAKTADEKLMDVILTVDGIEIDLEKFIDRWQEDVKRLIFDKAKEIVDDKFGDILGTLNDLRGRMQEDINKRLEDWEKEDASNV